MDLVMKTIQMLLVAGFASKIFIHRYIGNKNNNHISLGMTSFKIFWFYNKPVTSDYERLRKVCNLIHFHNIVAIFLLLIYSWLK